MVDWVVPELELSCSRVEVGEEPGGGEGGDGREVVEDHAVYGVAEVDSPRDAVAVENHPQPQVANQR